MFKHGKITHEYGLSYARNIPYHTLKQMEQSVANVQKLFKKKLDIFEREEGWSFRYHQFQKLMEL